MVGKRNPVLVHIQEYLQEGGRYKPSEEGQSHKARAAASCSVRERDILQQLGSSPPGRIPVYTHQE